MSELVLAGTEWNKGERSRRQRTKQVSTSSKAQRFLRKLSGSQEGAPLLHARDPRESEDDSRERFPSEQAKQSVGATRPEGELL